MSTSMRLKLLCRIFIILSSWLLMLLHNYTYSTMEVLAEFCILAAVCGSHPGLAACNV